MAISYQRKLGDGTIVIDSGTSNVGIGTNDPGAKLEISDTTTGIGAIISNTTHNSKLQIYTIAVGKNSEIWFGDAADDDIGKIDYDHANNSLAFFTNASERMRIASGGSVGIGTTNPPRKLSVETNDTATYSASVNASEISIARKNSSNTAGQVAAISLNATGWSGQTTGVVVLNAIARQGNFSNADFAIQNRVGGNFVETFRITTYGNVGIGTDTPDDNVNTGNYFKPDGGGRFLTVKDSSGSFIMLESSTTTDDDQIGGIYFNNTGGQADAHLHVAGIDAILHKHGTNDALSGGDLRFFTKPSGSGSNGPRMVILQNGNVGIGTTSPGATLEVNSTEPQILIKNPVSATGNAVLKFEEGSGSTQNATITFNQGGQNNLTIATGYQSSNDENRIYLAPAGNIGLTVRGGTGSDNGNVGIGTTSPSSKLHISGATDESIIRLQNTATSLSLGDTIGALQFYNSDTTDDSPNIAASIYATAGPSGGSGYLSFRTTEAGTEGAAATATMTLTNGGNVGIGTTNPSRMLHIRKDVHNGIGSVIRLENSTGGGDNKVGILFTDGAYNSWIKGGRYDSETKSFLSFETTDSEAVRIDGDGNVGIGKTDPSAPLHINGGSTNQVVKIQSTTAPYVRFKEGGTDVGFIQFGTDVYISNQKAGTLNFRTNNTDKMTILSGGNVGIGTTSPATKLDVDGFAKFAKHYREGGFSALGATVDDWYTIADFSLNSATFTYENFKGTVNWGYGGSTSWYAVEFDVYFRGNNSIAADGAYVRWSYRQTGNAEGKGGSAIRIIRSDDVTYEVQISPITNYGVVNWEVVSPKYSSAITLTTHDTLQTASTALSSSKIVQDSNFYVNGKIGIGTTSVPSEANLSLAAKTTTEGGHLVINKATSSTHATHIDNNTDTFRIMKGTDSASGSVQFILKHTNGNVGIGTTSPGFKLQVGTPAVVSGSDYSWSFDLTRANSTSRGFSIGQADGGGVVVMGGHNTDMAFGHTFGTDTNGNPLFYETMRIQHVDQAVGNVGIGTTSPASKLDVNSGISSSSIDVIKLSQATTGAVKAAASLGLSIQNGGEATNAADLWFTTASGGATSERMRITSGGNVAIGTTTANTLLSIDGQADNGVSIQGIGTTATRGFFGLDANGDGYFYLVNGGTFTKNIQLSSDLNVDNYIMGDLGIGTASPNTKLHVSGSIKAEGNGTDQYFFEGVRTGVGTTIRIYDNANTAYIDSYNNMAFRANQNGGSGGNFRFTGGNVGIGTTSPSSRLHINKENALSVLTISRGGTDLAVSTDIGSIEFKADYQGSPISYGNIKMYSNSLSGVRSSLDFNVKSASGSVQTGLTVQGNSGTPRVGIGTTSPDSTLHVSSSSPIITISNSDTSIVDEQVIGQIDFKSLDGSTNMTNVFGSIRTEAEGTLDNGVNDGGKMVFSTFKQSTTLVDQMVIDRDGNVGIGTTSPNQLLHTVGGTVKVESDGGNAAGAVLELKHANNNTTDVCATINFTNNIGGYAAIEGGTTGANNTGYLAFKTDNAGTQGEAVRILGNGNVGMGTTNPSYKLTVDNDSANTNNPALYVKNPNSSTAAVIAEFVGDSDSIQIKNIGTGDYAIYNSQQDNGIALFDGTGGVEIKYAGTTTLESDSTGGIKVTGQLSATGDVVAYSSDKRLKENIKPIKNAVDKIKQLKGVTFDWNEKSEELGFEPSTKTNDVGVIAQDVEAVFPQLVHLAPFDIGSDEEGKATSKTGEDYKTVNYARLTAVLIEAVKEQQQQIDELKAKLDGITK